MKWGRKAALLLLVNALPIGAALVVLELRRQGALAVRPLPQESVGSLALIAVVLMGIVALGWVVYPPIQELRDAARRRARGPFALLWRALAGLLALDLLLLAALAIALLGAEVLLLARFAGAVRGP